MTAAIWWVRRDHRLTDNQALSAALEQANHVIPVFVLDPVLLSAPDAGDKRVAFMLGSLRRLDADLQTKGSRLIVRHGDPVAELTNLLHETGARVIFAEEDYWPYGRQRDTDIANTLPLHLTSGLTVHPPATVRKADRTPYTVFTPFSRRWKELPPPDPASVLAAPERMPTLPDLSSLPIPTEPALSPKLPYPPSETEAQRRLQAFANGESAGIHQYAQHRDRMDLAGTSRLSPYLRFGMISARQAVLSALHARNTAQTDEARKGAETWLNELIWREFYMAILYHFPHVLEESFRANFQNIAWENDETAFVAWCQGRTGYPIVDAAMRQLVETGWMHNRARMIVASFLVKDLLIDWRWGERFFMQHLMDGDPAANNGGWQWSAGTGTDAAPYFRIFNPTLQGKRYDPEGAYIRRWLPELSGVPDRYIHEPQKMSHTAQKEAHCLIGHDYPEPIVDHSWARERVLEAFSRAKELAGNA